jgi:dimeric dUTPase (all-alpha-NTP-PPase superfamily)
MQKLLKMQDNFNLLFDLQQALQKMHGHHFDKMTIEEKENYTKDHVLYLLEETHELLREINFKTYKKTRKPIKIENIREELSDILHFYVNLCLVWGVSADQIVESFKQKNAVNVQRVKNPQY